MQSLTTVAIVVGRALRDLQGQISSPGGVQDLLYRLGWSWPPGLDTSTLTLDFSEVLTALASLEFDLDAGADTSTLVADTGNLIEAIAGLATAVTTAVNGLSTIPAYLTATNLATELPVRLLDYLIVDILLRSAPSVVSVCNCIGLVSFDPYVANNAIFQVEHVRRVIHWDRVPTLFSSPQQLFVDVYGWGAATYNGDNLVAAIGTILQMVGFSARVALLSPAAEKNLTGNAPPNPDPSPPQQISVILFQDYIAGGVSAGLSVFPLRPTSAGTDGGLALVPFAHFQPAGAAWTFPLTDQLTFAISASGTVDPSLGVVLLFRVGKPPSLLLNAFTSGTPLSPVSGQLSAQVAYAPTDPDGVSLLSCEGVDVSAQSLTCDGGLVLANGVPDISVGGAVGKGSLSLDPSLMDGFLQSIMPADAVDVAFDLGIQWTGRNGFSFTGGAGGSLNIPLHLDLGPISVDDMQVSFSPQATPMAITIGVSASGELGPI